MKAYKMDSGIFDYIIGESCIMHLLKLIMLLYYLLNAGSCKECVLYTFRCDMNGLPEDLTCGFPRH